MVDRLQIERAEERHQLRTRISELAAENERLRRLVMAQSRAIHSPEALSRTGAVKVGYANSTAPDNPFVTPAPEGQQPVAKAVELSGNAGELIEKMAEAIRGDTTSDDTPWAALSEDRKTGWRGDAERALAVVKEYLTSQAAAALRLSAGGGWRTMESAPKDAILRTYLSASLIQSQAVRIAELEAGLEPFAQRCDEAVRLDDGDNDGVTVKTKHLRAARALLNRRAEG